MGLIRGCVLGFLCAAFYHVYYITAFLSATDLDLRPITGRWHAACSYVGIAVWLLFYDTVVRWRHNKPLLDFVSNAEIASRAWRIDEQRVRALMEANDGIFPHGTFICRLMAYPRQYEGGRTTRDVNEERERILEHLEDEVSKRNRDIIF